MITGRPATKPTEEQVTAICDALRKHAFRETAIACAGVSPYVVRNWIRAGVNDRKSGADTLEARLVERMDEAERLAEFELIGGIQRAGLEPFLKSSGEHGDTFQPPSWQALAWIAERRGAKRWGVKKQLSVSIDKDREKLLAAAEKTLSQDDYAKLLEALIADEESGDDGAGAASYDSSES